MKSLNSVYRWIFCYLSYPAQEKTIGIRESEIGKCKAAIQVIIQIVCRLAQLGVVIYACIALSRIAPGEDSAHKSVLGEFDSSFQVQGYALDPAYNVVYDGDDLSREYETSVFITTAYTRIVQQQGICDESRANCQTDTDCKSLGNQSFDGILTGKCNLATQKCLMNGWCVSSPAEFHCLETMNSFSVVMDHWVRFPEFKEVVSDVLTVSLSDIITSVFPDQTFEETLASAVNETLNIAVGVEWECYRNVWMSETHCKHHYTYFQLPSLHNKPKLKGRAKQISTTASTSYGVGPHKVLMRNLTIATGIHLTTVVDSKLYQFYLINFLSTVGSFIGMFIAANTIAYLFLVYCVKIKRKLSAEYD